MYDHHLHANKAQLNIYDSNACQNVYDYAYHFKFHVFNIQFKTDTSIFKVIIQPLMILCYCLSRH